VQVCNFLNAILRLKKYVKICTVYARGHFLRYINFNKNNINYFALLTILNNALSSKLRFEMTSLL
jgi:hypothetical protein